MIRTEREYLKSQDRLKDDQRIIKMQRDKLVEMGLSDDDVQLALEPTLSFQEQLVEEVQAYEQMRRGILGPIFSLDNIGRVLIGLRIASGLSQREFAEKLGVPESSVSRDERNEYHGISIERAQKILKTFHVTTKVEFEITA
jgi:DNA-binding XRE family transcriptional regulator